jgi:hypothetical protein
MPPGDLTITAIRQISVPATSTALCNTPIQTTATMPLINVYTVITVPVTRIVEYTSQPVSGAKASESRYRMAPVRAICTSRKQTTA